MQELKKMKNHTNSKTPNHTSHNGPSEGISNVHKRKKIKMSHNLPKKMGKLMDLFITKILSKSDQYFSTLQSDESD